LKRISATVILLSLLFFLFYDFKKNICYCDAFELSILFIL